MSKAKPLLCPVCKTNPISTSKAQRCRSCYYARTGIESFARVPKCSDCGEVLPSPNAKRCRPCHLKHLSEESEARQALRQAEVAAASPQIKEPLASYEEAQQQWDRCIGRMKQRKESVPKKPNGRERVVVVPDIHAPFHEPDMLAYICETEGPKCAKAICIGDVSDAYAFSTFTKYEKVSFAEEWAAVTQVVDALSRSFHEVEIIIGNHDARLEKRLLERLTPDMIDAIRYMTGNILCPLTALAKQYSNVTIAKHETPSGHYVDWFTTDGDVWLGHPEKFSKIPGASLRAVEDWILDNEVALGLDKYRLIVMGHTHQLEIIPWRSNQLLVSAGCICQTQSYQTKPRIGGRPQKRGYVWYEKDNGKVDVNSVGMHWFVE
jgi:predicted phosphodiesterase